MGRLVHTVFGSSSLVAHVLHYPSPNANSFLIGTAVINTHTRGHCRASLFPSGKPLWPQYGSRVSCSPGYAPEPREPNLICSCNVSRITLTAFATNIIGSSTARFGSSTASGTCRRGSDGVVCVCVFITAGPSTKLCSHRHAKMGEARVELKTPNWDALSWKMNLHLSMQGIRDYCFDPINFCTSNFCTRKSA